MHRYMTGSFFLICLLATIGMFLILPPKNEVFIYSFISVVSFTVFFLALTFKSLKYAILGFVGVFSFFTMNYLIGFQILNTVLLISVIMGVAFLIKK